MRRSFSRFYVKDPMVSTKILFKDQHLGSRGLNGRHLISPELQPFEISIGDIDLDFGGDLGSRI